MIGSNYQDQSYSGNSKEDREFVREIDEDNCSIVLFVVLFYLIIALTCDVCSSENTQTLEIYTYTWHGSMVFSLCSIFFCLYLLDTVD